MPRLVEPRKTRKALRKLRKVAERAQGEGGPGLTNWEKDFVSGVTERLESYGSAFRDPAKGKLDEALSQRQTHVARVLDKKSRRARAAPGKEADKLGDKPKPRSTFKRKPPKRSGNARDINDDLAPSPSETPESRRAGLRIVPRAKT